MLQQKPTTPFPSAASRISTALVLLWLSLSQGAAGARDPAWWDIEILLTAEGKYSLRQGDAVATADFAFSNRWRGSIERDDSDYLLYHANSELIRWTLREKSLNEEILSLLTESDAAGKPSFRMNYVLSQGNDLVFDFAVEGFPVPVGPAPAKFDLALPRTRGGAEPSADSHYDDFIVQGSNAVHVKEAKIYRGAVERKFSWSWKHEKWLMAETENIFISNLHKAVVKIIIVPHN
ncbi:MAG: hypothetical protein PHX45_00455 [Acidobacteriota bacterium]|nr:hypothetical protein [Acidobacteriota bacterium]